jgi:peptide/nickel transport system substrate-binding protein
VSNAPSLGRQSRLWRILALLLAFGLIAGACGDDDGDAGVDPDDTTTTTAGDDGPDDEPAGEITPGGTLIVGLEAEQSNWLPGNATFGNPGTTAARAVYDSIAARGADGQIYPYLAESIEPNDDLSEWTITLRSGITFHDGTELNAELMKRIFDEYLNIEGSTALGAIADVESVRVDDDLTYTYLLTETVASFPDNLVGQAGWAFSIEACEAAGGRDGDCGEQMTGTGPFKFVSWSRDSELRLERNENYWRTDADGNPLPYLDQLVFRPIPDEDSRIQSVRSGDVHVGQTLRQSTVRAARELPQTYEAIGNNGGGTIFNTTTAPVDDVRVRLGLAYAVDQEDLVEVLGGTGITPPQTQFFSPDSPWFSTVVEEAWPKYDPDLAATYLQEYRDDPSRSDGKPAGAPISVVFNCPPDPSLIDLAQAYQSFWQAVEVEVELVQVEQAQHIQNALAGDFMMNCWRAGGQEDPYTSLGNAFSNPGTNPVNFTRYGSAEIDANLEVLRTSSDFDERYAAVEAIGLELAENVPQIWTGGTATALFAVEEVRNLDGWTIPGPDGAPLTEGDGVINAVIYWAEVWIES